MFNVFTILSNLILNLPKHMRCCFLVSGQKGRDVEAHLSFPPPPRLIKIILEYLPPEIWEDSPLYDNNEKHLF